jgi:hypothetical protein
MTVEQGDKTMIVRCHAHKTEYCYEISRWEHAVYSNTRVDRGFRDLAIETE